MKLQILDMITFLALPNSFEMCNCSPERYVHTKCTYLQMRSSIWEIDFISLRNWGGGRIETYWNQWEVSTNRIRVHSTVSTTL